MKKIYSLYVKGQAWLFRWGYWVNTTFGWRWGQNSDAIITDDNQKLLRQRLTDNYGNIPESPEKYEAAVPLLPSYLMSKELIKMMKDLGFSQCSAYQNFNDSREINKNNFSGGTFDAEISFTHPLFGKDTSLCFVFSSTRDSYRYSGGNPVYPDISSGSVNLALENVQYLYFVKNNVSQGYNTIQRTIPSVAEITENFILIKNDKTNEFILTQESGTTPSTRLDILFGFFLSSNGKQVFYIPANDNNPIFTLENDESVMKYSVGTNTGFLNGELIVNQIESVGMVLPCYFTNYGTTNITLDVQCPSLKKAKGDFKLHKEYIIDNEVYYCMYQNGTNAILFDTGEAVSK